MWDNIDVEFIFIPCLYLQSTIFFFRSNESQQYNRWLDKCRNHSTCKQIVWPK